MSENENTIVCIRSLLSVTATMRGNCIREDAADELGMR